MLAVITVDSGHINLENELTRVGEEDREESQSLEKKQPRGEDP